MRLVLLALILICLISLTFDFFVNRPTRIIQIRLTNALNVVEDLTDNLTKALYEISSLRKTIRAKDATIAELNQAIVLIDEAKRKQGL